MYPVSQEMQRCIHQCLGCYQACTAMAAGHCLEKGGEHTRPDHFRLMMECAEICRTAAHFMLLDSPRHAGICAQCAEICDACAASCDGLEGMETCVEACRKCAEICRQMAGGKLARAA